MQRFLFLTLALIFMSGSCDKEIEEERVLTDFYKDATIMLFANAKLKYDEKLTGGDYYVNPDGQVVQSAKDAEYYRFNGSGSVFEKEGEYRILTARHVVDLSPSDLLRSSDLALQSVKQYFIDAKLLVDPEKIEVLELADHYLELEDPVGFLVPNNFSVTALRDALSSSPNRIPRGCFEFTRQQLGEVYDFAVVSPNNSALFQPKATFATSDLANQEAIKMDAKLACASFPSTEKFTTTPETSEGQLNVFDGERLGITMNFISKGSSGASLISNNKIVGIVSRRDLTTDLRQYAVPAPIFNLKLRNSFDN